MDNNGEPPQVTLSKGNEHNNPIIDDETKSSGDKFFPKEKPTHSLYPDSSKRSSYMGCSVGGYSGA
jgi:hypothetical protein